MSNSIYYLSKWCKSFVQGDEVALFHVLLFGLVFMSKSDKEWLFKHKNGVSFDDVVLRFGESSDLLIANGLLVESLESDEGLIQSMRFDLSQNIYLDLMYLLLTDGCNLKCRYCFEDTPNAPSFHAKHMTKQVAIAALHSFARLTQKYGSSDGKRIIHLYGGEPLLNQKVLRAVVEEVDIMKFSGELPDNTNVVIVTNGTLLTVEMAQFFAKHQVTIGISLDGPKNINNVYRIAKNKHTDAFESVVNAYNIARDAGVTVGLSVTLTPEVVQNFDEVLDYFVNDLKISDGLSFNIMHFNPAVNLDDNYFELASQCLIKSFERFRELGVYEERMMRKAMAFTSGQPIFSDCGVNGNQIVIAPDGMIGVCQDFVKPRTYFQGSVLDSSFDPVAEGLFNDWKNRSPFFMDACINCEAVAMCGGGCPASVELKTGNRWNIDERICPHSKQSLEWLVWQAYNNVMSE
jgi:uncharacterized protein